MNIPPDITPSEIVLLLCDQFAPLPARRRLSLRERIAFEWDKGAWLLIGLVIGTALLVGLGDTEDDLKVPSKIAGGVLDVVLPAIWWYRRRRMDPEAVDREMVSPVCPLNGTREAGFEELVRVTIAAALLADEEAGVMRLMSEGGELMARFDESEAPRPWPPKNTLEDRLQRWRVISVRDLIYDWMADGSNFPYTRAMRLIEHSAVLRGLGSATADAIDPVPAEELLRKCREGRPEIWRALQMSIREGLAERTVAPRMEEIAGGRAVVPKFDYNEIPIGNLDAPEAATATSGSEQFNAEPEPKQMGTGGTILFFAVTLGANAIALIFNRDNVTATGVSIALTLVLSPVVHYLTQRKMMHLRMVRQRAGLLPLSAADEGFLQGTQIDWTLKHYLGLAGFVLLISIPVAIWGAFPSILLPVVILLALWVRNAGQTGKLYARTSAEVVAGRVRELAVATNASAGAGVTEAVAAAKGTSEPTHSRKAPGSPGIPDKPTLASELPPAAPQIMELLDRWSHRRATFRRLHWISLAVLTGGYTLMSLAFWNIGDTPWIDPNNGATHIPGALIFPLGLTVMGLATMLLGIGKKNPLDSRQEKESQREHEGEGESRHGAIAAWITFWRIAILIEAPLLFSIDPPSAAAHARHPIFAGAALLFLAAHWVWMELVTARAMRELPVPGPRRLVMLRVFGSPAFDDLVELIRPWQRVGLIEHLEGYDTVGERADVQAAVSAGDVDRALVKNVSEMQARLAQASTEPDAALRYQRHAFQCTDATWREAIQAILGRADVVVMDLSSLSESNQGCAWELGRLLDWVPLANVTLLVNDSTDLNCLRKILESAAETMAEDSPNRSNPVSAWQVIRIGGLSARQPNESYYDWRRRVDHRLDPALLTSWLLATARQPQDLQTTGVARRWGRQAGGWPLLIALSAMWAFSRGRL